MKSNPLFDIEFLNKLFSQLEREIYARVTALDLNELPIEYIEGKVTGGSINVDGKSAVRRTCSVTMVAKDININDFYWGLKNKFKLEVGLLNSINSNYENIIWFKLGLYVITSFNTTQNTNSYTINISGKDKMCLLNGDLAGSLPHTTDFGIEEYHDKVTDTVTYTSIPIKDIIREAVQNFGGELAKNIIINDIEDAGLELLEYRGNVPLYLFRQINSDLFLNMTINPNLKCYIKGKQTTVSDKSIIYDNLIDLEGEIESTTIQLDLAGDEYKIAKFEYGSIPGYRLTDLVYAGELVANIGESLTSVLDKIKNMLGEFEYFYDLLGRFVFQRKPNYINIAWNPIAEKDELVYIDAAVNSSSFSWNFTNGTLISSFLNTPNLLNARNDFAVWGNKKTPSGKEIPIHMRYAIDNKPDYYKSYNNIIYTTDKNLINNMYEARKKELMDELLKNLNAFKLKFEVPSELLTPLKLDDGTYSIGWWDIRDWYEYYKIITREEPNRTMKWYSLNDLTGCIPANLIPGNSSSTGHVWLVIKNPRTGKYNLLHGSGKYNENVTSHLLCYYSVLDPTSSKGYVTYPTDPPEYGDFHAPYSGCTPTHTYLEFLKSDVEQLGNIVYFYNPKFPDADSTQEAIEVQVLKEMEKWLKENPVEYVDWREIIYLMAIDYRRHYHDDDFLSIISKNNYQYYPSGITGYELYYIDLEGFWRELYAPNPEIEYLEIEATEASDISQDNLFVQYGYRKATEEDLLNVKLEDLYIIQNSKLYPFIKSPYCKLNSNVNSGELYFYLTSDGSMNMGTNDRNILILKNLKEIYIKNTELFMVKNDLNSNQYLTWMDKNKNPILVFLSSTNDIITDDNQYILFVWACYEKVDKNLLYVHDKDYLSFDSLDSLVQSLYKTNGNYNTSIRVGKLNNYGETVSGETEFTELITYAQGYYSYHNDPDTANYWLKDITENPENIIFWFDFLDAEGSDLNRYSVPVIGSRTKSINDKDVKSIYYREIPTTIFLSGEETYEHQTGYTYIQLLPTMENLFTISSKGKSAQEKINELLYNHSYCIETVSVTALPIYHLEPNYRIFIQDHNSHIHGEYIVDKLTIPLTHNGTMNISATKAVTNII